MGTDKPYICVQPTQGGFNTPNPHSSNLYRDLLSSMGEMHLDRPNSTGTVIETIDSMQPVVELTGPSFLHAFLAKRFQSRMQMVR